MTVVSGDVFIKPEEVALVKLLGLPNKQIAVRLGLARSGAVNQRTARLFGKLGVDNRTGAVIAAIKAGICTLDEVEY